MRQTSRFGETENERLDKGMCAKRVSPDQCETHVTRLRSSYLLLQSLYGHITEIRDYIQPTGNHYVTLEIFKSN